MSHTFRDGTPVAGGPLVPIPVGGQQALDPYRSLGTYPGARPDDGQDWRVDLFDYLRIFSKHKWLILGCVGVFLALGAARTLMQTPLYTATIRLQIDRDSVKVVESGEVSPQQNVDTDFLRTQFELLRSRAMAERVVTIARLADDPDFTKRREFSITTAASEVLGSPRATAAIVDRSRLEQAATAVVVLGVDVRPVLGSRLVDLTYTDPQPDRAQRIANSFGEAFAASNVDKRFQANAYAKTFLEDQIAQLKEKLEGSEKALLAFAEQQQIVVLSEKSTTVEANLQAANASLSQIIAERIKNEQLWRQVDASNAIDLPQLLTNAVVDGLRGKRNLLVAEYQEKLETFKPSYPDMVQIANKIREIDRQLAAEVKTIKSSYRAAFDGSSQQVIEMTSRVAKLKGEALELQNQMIKYDFLKRDVETNRSLYNGLLNRYKQVDVASGVGANNVFVIDKAIAPNAPSSPNMPRALLLSLALGLGIGLMGAVALERLDDRVRSAEEIERIAGLPTLGIIPKIADPANVQAEIGDPRSGVSEAYRSLCTALQFSTESGLPKTLVVTSAGPAEGKSFTALAISRHFAAMGMKVLIVDADLRNPSLHKKLSQDNSIGLSNYLTGACTPPDAFQATESPNLAFMASGPLPPNAADLLAGKRLFSLLSVGLEVFDLIVLDGPPVLGLADAQLLSNAASATVFVVSAGQARVGLVRGALRRLQLARCPIIGLVLTKFDARQAGYGYSYGYGYGYGHNPYAYGQNSVSTIGGGQTSSDDARRPELTKSA